MRHRAAVRIPLAIALSLAVPLAACGKSSPAGGGSTTTTTVSVTGGAQHASRPRPAPSPAARAAALAYAHAVNLRPGDLRGFTVTHSAPKHPSAIETRLGDELHHCLSTGSGSGTLAEASSPQFSPNGAVGHYSVSSSVTVQRSSAEAARALAVYRSPRTRTCLSHYFTELLKADGPHGAHVGPVTVKYGTPPARGSGGGFALRFNASVTLDGVQLPFYVDALGFIEHAATVSMFTNGLPQPFPARLEERLYSLLLARAKAHST